MGIGDCPNCFITKSEDDHYGHTSGSSGSTSGGGYNNDNCGDNDRRKTTKISKKFNKIRNVIFGGGKRVIFYGPEFQKRYEKERRNRIRKRDLLRDCCTTSGGETPSKSHTDIQISKPIITSTETDKQTMGRSDLKTLRQLCVETLASMPYGGAILEELATVSESLSHLTKAKEDQMRNVIPIPVPTERSPSPPPLPPPVAPARNRRKIIVQQQYEPPLPSPPLPSPPPPPIPSPPKFDDDEFVSAAVDDEFKNKNYASIQPNAISTQDFIEYDRKLTPSHNQRPIDEQALAEQIISPSAHQKQKENVPQHQREIEMEIKREEDGNKNVVRDEENMTIGTAAGAAANSNMKNRLLAIIRETEQEQQQSTTENSTNTPNESENSEIKQNSETNRNTNPDPDNMFAYQNYKSTLTGPGSQTDDIFEEFNKRFSNIEQSFRPLSVNLDNVTKRYSNLETSSFETKKRLENGNIVFETFDKNRQKLSSVDGKIIENHNDSESKLVGNHDKNVKNEKIAENKMYENFPHQQKLQDEKLHQQHKTQEQHSTKTQTESQTDQKSSPPQQQQQQPSQPPKDEFIFKEFDFVPKTIKTDQFFTTPRQSTPADTTNLHQEKSKSHHNIFFGKPNPFEELNEEFKRKFETQLRSPNLGARPLSLHETMRLNSNNFSDWMKHAKTQMTTESSENITKPLLKEEFMVRGGRSFSTAEIRAPRISPNVMDSAEQYEEIHRQYDSSVGRRNQVLQTRQSMIDQTPITGHVSMERTRRMSLPKELHDKQLSYIRQKERELQVEFERLEAERRKLEKEMTDWSENVELQAQNFGSQQLSEAEEFRQKMHNEWLNKVAEREERRMQKIVKISKSSDDAPIKSSSARNDLGDEFLHKVKERRSKLNMPSDSDWESGAESQPTPKPTDDSTPKERIINIKIIEGEKEADPKQLPKHLQEFLELQQQQLLQNVIDNNNQSSDTMKEECTTTTKTSSTTMSTKDEMTATPPPPPPPPKPPTPVLGPKFKAKGPKGIWSPNSKSVDNLRTCGTTTTSSTQHTNNRGEQRGDTQDPKKPVWTPNTADPSPTFDRKEFRPVNFESPTFQRKVYTRQESDPVPPPWRNPLDNQQKTTAPLQQSLSTSNLSNYGFTRNHNVINLPRTQNPTVTLLQKAREGQIPRVTQQFADHINQQQQQQLPNHFARINIKQSNPLPAFMNKPNPNEIVHNIRREYMSESETDNDRSRKMTESLTPRSPVEGIGPMTKDGMPIVLRSEVNENNQSRWYKKMYNTLHKAKDDDDYLVVRYKTRRGRYPYKPSNGYMSEPEPNYESDYSVKYNTLDRRRIPSTGSQQYYEKSYGTMPNPVKPNYEHYKNQPGRIENYTPGRSSISEKETRQWWDEVMDIFDGWLDENYSPLPYFSIVFAREVQKFHLEQQKHVPKHFAQGYLSKALNEGGYESDSSLLFKKQVESNLAPLSPVEQKQMYRNMQSGGEPPLQGFRKPAPEKPKDDQEIEYFPITSTLTKMRVHRNKFVSEPTTSTGQQQREVLCYPITSVTKPIDLFGSYSSTARSFIPISPPPPPSRRSSKRNTILKMFSGSTHTSLRASAKSPNRHEACFATSDRYLESKKSPGSSSFKKSCESLRSKSAGPLGSYSRSSLKEEKNMENTTRIARRQYVRVSSVSPVNRSRMSESRKSSPSPVAFGRGISRERTFAEEKKRLELQCQDIRAPTRMLRNPALKSPDEVKRALQTTFRLPSRERNACIKTTVSSGRRTGTANAFRATSSVVSSKKSPVGDKNARVSVNRERSVVETSTPARLKTSSPKVTTSVVYKQNSGRISKPLEKSRSKTCISNSNVSLARTNSTYSIDSSSSKKKSSSRPHTIIRSNSKGNLSPVTVSGSKTSRRRRISASKEKIEIKKKNGVAVEESKIEQEIYISSNDRRPADHHENQRRDRNDADEKEVIQALNTAIVEQKGNVRGEHFFQNLFCRNLPSPTPSSSSSLYRNTSVLEKAKLWNTISHKSEPTLPQQNVYLANRKPVSCSKFKILEQEHANSRMSRSLSPNRAYRTNRIVADHITKFDSLCQLSSEDDEEFGNITKSLTFSYQERSRSEPPKQHTILTEIQQPFEPVVIHGRTKSIEYRSESPARSARSPSCRRIHSFRSHQSSSDATDNHYKRVNRARSLGSADRSPSRQSLIEQSYNDLSRSSCSLNLNYERHNSACNHQRSDRFKELNQFYSTLERVGQLERATSTSDIRPIRGDEEVIDFDLWKRIREREKAEKELNYLVRKLKEEQKEKDFLFQPHDVDDLRWDRRRDSGLRIKEKSVEDLRETFHKKAQEANHDVNENVKQKMDSDKGTYKLLYRGSSVLDLASNMVEKYNPPEKGDAPKSKVKEFSKREDKPLGLSTKLISTLSKDQINKIKHQLSEIYSNSPLPTQKASEKYEEISEKFVITVPPPPQSTSKDKSILTVRSNSLLTREELLNPVLAKHQSRLSERAESIGTINESKTRTERSTSDNRPEVNPLSESDKRRLSETLCREIKDRVSQRRQEKQDLHPKETRGAFAAEQAKLSLPDCRTVRPRSQSEENYPSTSSQASRLESVAIRREKKSALDKRRPASVCESVASSEASNHTVIFKQIQQQSHQKNISEDVRAKIKYFEEIKKEDPLKGTTIYHAREDSSPDEEEVMKAIEEKLKAKKAQEEQRSRSPGLSSSVTDIREMFGEKQFSSFQSVERKSHSVPPPSSNPEKRYSTTEVIIHETHPVSDHSSFESVYRSRSISPNLEKQHKSYLNLVKTGDVKKIKDKFESLDVSLTNSYWSECEPTPPPPKSPRRYRSDPELDKEFFEKRGTSPKKITVKDHEAGDVSRITHRFELRNSSASSSSSRGRSRTRRERRAISPIPKVSMKKDDRFMPHIDIISKTALLKHEIKCPSASWPSRHNPVSEVRETMETQENMSILGQMYTSTPDFRELKDISSYLSGSWVAHQFPRPQDNARSLTHPQKTAENEKIKKRLSPRPSSTSPPRNKSLITSILKPYYDIFADQKFDPNVHRPKYRYVPGKQLEAEALWKKLQHNINKPSVKFEEPAVVPPPPPQKGVPLHSSQSPESPRRYIEGDVNIHYRTPIRHEFKELIPEDELAHRQAEAMRRLYQEEKRRKYLQELQDMNNRRHTDNFTPSQKSPIALNRYDTFQADLSPKSPVMQTRTVARALYNFQGQSARELSFRKGDLIYIRRQIDKNWYEGEQNANVGLFPSNYVEIITKDTQRAAPSKRPAEGQARAKFNFTAASAIELSLNKGEIVTLTRRVDDNWFEGKIANRKGIFPVTYVEVLHEIGTETKPVGSPAAHSLIITPTLEQSTSKDLYATTNGSSLTNGGRLTNGGGTNGDLVRDSKGQHKTEVLHVDTNSEPIAFRALYKYSPQNSDELELQEGDIVYVLEKCDDGWYVGTSHRTGYFGTFPGNYVELM